MKDQFYTLDEVASLLKMSYMTVFRWAKSGKLPAFKFGKQYRVSQETLLQFISEAQVKVKEKKL